MHPKATAPHSLPNFTNPQTHISKHLTAIIFGGGLAGSILAEHFLSDGEEVLLVNDPKKSLCSRVAAGLINPIGGKRLKRVWLADTLIPHALAYYRMLEGQSQQQLFYPRSIHRHFSNSDETKLWQKRLEEPAYSESTTPLTKGEASLLRCNQTPCGETGFIIPHVGYLDTNALLDLLHADFEAKSLLLSSTFNYDEIQLTTDGVSFRDFTADLAIFTEGHLATQNPFFSFIPYKPAKGVIATITLSPNSSLNLHPSPYPSPILLKGKFIIPRHDGTIQVGATYNWNDPTDTPDEKGIQELKQFLDANLGPDTWKFNQIKAGVRPATAGAYPVVGPNPEHRQLITFNGFGSKGSMQIPYFANTLLASLQGHSELPAETLPARFVKKASAKQKRWIATNVVKETILQTLAPGDIAIDATAGNGHDTQWLAETVGSEGHVFAYDVQEQALLSTRQRLTKQGLIPQATLIKCGHESLLETIPSEHQGSIAAIVFNLGFLPGGNVELITQADTTSRALRASLKLLKPGGILSITLYPTHPGAQQEVDLVLSWFHGLPEAEFLTRIEPHPQGNPASPYPIFVTKRQRPARLKKPESIAE